MSNSIVTHLPVGFKHFNAMHAYKPESQRVGNWQPSLRVETKPLSSHDRQKLASGLSGGIDAIAHALRVNRYTDRIIAHNLFKIIPSEARFPIASWLHLRGFPNFLNLSLGL